MAIQPRFHAPSATLTLMCGLLAACGPLPELTDIKEELANEEICATSTPIALGQSIGGQLSSGDCMLFGEILSDRWSLNVAQEMSIRIDVTSPAYDAMIELRDESDYVIAYGDDFQGPSNARIIQTVSAGSYSIVVGRIPGQTTTGDYQLSVREGPDCSPIGALTMGSSVTGQLEANDCIHMYGELIDNWTLSLSESERVRIDLTSTAFDEIILVRNDQGWVEWYGDWNSAAGHARVETTLAPGEWTISVGSPFDDARGSYALSVDVVPPCEPGTDIVIGQEFNGEISASDCQFDMWAPADSFALVVTEEALLDIHMKSSDFEPLMVLRNQQGFDEAFASDEMQDGSARTKVSLSPGTYSLFAIAPSFPQQGGYRLTVSEVVCDEPATITFGHSVNGVLEVDDCVRVGGAYKDPWELILSSETTVRIDLKSQEFDTWLELRDAQGSLIESNDDGGSGVNSRIDRTLAAGTYIIDASAFGPGQTGSYVLTVGTPPAPAIGQGSMGARAERPTSKPQASSENESVASRLQRLRGHISPRAVSIVDALYGSSRRAGG